MKNFIAYGDLVDFTAGATVVSGQFVFLSSGLYGFATNDVASGAKGVLKSKGIFDYAKTSAQAWAVGDPVYWDSANAVFTNVPNGLAPVGAAVAIAANPSASGRLRLYEAPSTSPAAPASFTFAAAAGATNVANVTITPKDSSGNALTGVRGLEIWLSDDSGGAGLTGTTASGTVTAKSGEGTVLTALTAKKHVKALTKSAGTFVLEITDTAKTGFYVCVLNPVTGQVHASAQLVTGNYG